MTPGNAGEKERALTAWMRARGRIAIGFSGGVDSAYLAAVAVDALGADNVVALIGRSESLAGSEEDNARDVARRLGVPVLEVDTGELADPRYAANPTNRCYFCKSVLWETLVPLASERGFATVVDGTNADDLHDYRPGGRAAKERGVLSPLAEIGFTKEEIRECTRARGLPWWSRPSSPCLASRLPYGTAVTAERLRQVDRAESALRALGITGNLRVRHFGDRARVELDPAQLAAWSAGAPLDRLVAAVRDAGYAEVEVDARGFRSGSLNVVDGAAVSGH